MGEEFQHLVRHRDPRPLGLGLKDAEPKFVVGRMNVRHHAPAQTRAKAFLEALEVGRRLVRRHDHLAAVLDQRVEGVEELLLRRILAADELNVVDHQHVDGPELLLEGHGVAESQRLHEAVHKLLGRQIDDVAARVLLADMPGDGMHQMRLAEPDAAIEKQRVEGDGCRFCRAARHGERQFVRLADDKIRECVTRVEAGTKRFAGRRRPGGRAALLRHPWRLLGRQADFNLLHRSILGSGDDTQPVGILVRHPFAGQRRAGLECQRAVLETAYPKRLDPVPPGRIADILAHAVGDALPGVIDSGVGSAGDNIRGGAGSGGLGLLAVRTVLMMSV